VTGGAAPRSCFRYEPETRRRPVSGLVEVFIVVRRADEYLVVHRVPEDGGYWHGIAGGVEPGELPAAAAARELFEETGLAAQPAPLDRPFIYDAVTVYTFAVEVPPMWEPELNEEHDEYRWCSREDAIALLFWPEPKDLLRAL
jgi:8-oxo-dGTP pyrophosphatase MutT (NUDIX family)